MCSNGKQENQHERYTESDEIGEVPSSERTVCLVNWHNAWEPPNAPTSATATAERGHGCMFRPQGARPEGPAAHG